MPIRASTSNVTHFFFLQLPPTHVFFLLFSYSNKKANEENLKKKCLKSMICIDVYWIAPFLLAPNVTHFAWNHKHFYQPTKSIFSQWRVLGSALFLLTWQIILVYNGSLLIGIPPVYALFIILESWNTLKLTLLTSVFNVFWLSSKL